jgi:DNA-binding transcriptional ArsR family regulator
VAAARGDIVFAALADPTRRGLIESLALGPATATGLAAEAPISRQAVAKHLGQLLDAQLVRRSRRGREALYTLDPEPLTDVVAWSERVGRHWERRLERLHDAVED